MMGQLDATGMKRLHRQWRKEPTEPLAVILDGIGGPYNLGSIIRTAAAYRVDHLWIAGSSLTPRNKKTQRTALGTDRYLTWTAVDSVLEAIDAQRATGSRIVGVELTDSAEPIQDADLAGALALIIGHEDRGISKAALAACDAVVYFPQIGRVGSLNIATAASMAIWEARRAGWDSTS